MYLRLLIFFIISVFASASASGVEDSFELKVAELTFSSAKGDETVVSFSVPLVSPHKGRLHKINCRLDLMDWTEADDPINTLSFVRFEGSKKTDKKHELTASPKYFGKNLNVFCLAHPRL